jgi:hypothetical protein
MRGVCTPGRRPTLGNPPAVKRARCAQTGARRDRHAIGPGDQGLCPGRLSREERRVTLRMLDAPREQARRVDGREADPSVGIIDSQSVKGAETAGRATREFMDSGKKINGRKTVHRHRHHEHADHGDGLRSERPRP